MTINQYNRLADHVRASNRFEDALGILIYPLTVVCVLEWLAIVIMFS